MKPTPSPAPASPFIPILDLSGEIQSLWAPINEALQRVLRSGLFILGPDVKALEQECSAYFGAKHAIAVNSGTDALILGLKAMGVGPGDEVVTSAFTFIATAEAISHCGGTPVWADIEPGTFNLDPASVAKAITPRTKLILPVHLYGQSADLDGLFDIAYRKGLPVFEDVAQAAGATWRGRKLGGLGAMGALSFFPSKNLGAYGDAGMILTQRDDLAETCAMLRAHGSKIRYHHDLVGFNSRLDSMQAAILRIKLPLLDAALAHRRRVAGWFAQDMGKLPGLILPVEADPSLRPHSYNYYTVRVTGGKRDAVQAKLAAAGIGTMIYYPIPLHQQPCYRHLPAVSLPHTELAAKEVLSLPMGPHIDEPMARRIGAAMRAALA